MSMHFMTIETGSLNFREYIGRVPCIPKRGRVNLLASLRYSMDERGILVCQFSLAGFCKYGLLRDSLSLDEPVGSSARAFRTYYLSILSYSE